MGEQYSHLDETERRLIKQWSDNGLPLREIGRRLNRSHTTISRELKRNLWCGKYYYFHQAHLFYEKRLKARAQRYRLKSASLREYVCNKLKIGWSPELIAGRLKVTASDCYVSHESIYQYIYLEAPELVTYLARQHKNRRKKFPYRKATVRIRNRVSITERPESVNDREAIGHWESDTMIGGDRQCGLNVIVERASRLAHISLMRKKTAQETYKAVTRRLGNHHNALVKSITYDNGSENVLHEDVNNCLKTKSYFCAPYHSWEKGSVEQVNGLIRRFMPKGTVFSEIEPSEIN